jgi:hypothetical protein
MPQNVIRSIEYKGHTIEKVQDRIWHNGRWGTAPGYKPVYYEMLKSTSTEDEESLSDSKRLD